MIFRAPMRARDRDEPGADWLLDRGLVGIGDAPADAPKTARMVERFAALADGVFVWTVASDGAYRLGRISGAYRRDERGARAVGIGHVRPAEWLERPFAEDEVPPAVAATFVRGGRNFQRTHGERAEQRTAELWAATAPPAR